MLVRIAGRLWQREHQWFEILGVGLRIRTGDGEALERARATDQDLEFSTVRSPLSALLAPLLTDASNLLNTYWALSPFATPPLGRVELRLRPIARADIGGSPIARVREAVRRGHAGWDLEARRVLSARWSPVARIALEREVVLDQRALSFEPVRDGARLSPVGAVHAIRRAASAVRQRARQLVGT